MSFHLMLSSEAAKDTYPQNHGGDFKVLLNHTLDCKTEPWEAALVEMSLTGQAFPNIPSDNVNITVSASGRPEYENDYIVSYGTVNYMYAEFIHMTERGARMKEHVIRMPHKHYNLRTFKETFVGLFQKEFGGGIIFSDESLIIEIYDAKPGDFLVCKFSASFRHLFQIDEKSVKPMEVAGRKVRSVYPIKKPALREDESKLIYTPFDLLKEVHFQVVGIKVFEFTDQYWTIGMFVEAINVIGNTFKKDFFLENLYIEATTTLAPIIWYL